ncbi:prepilin peptidase [Devosia sp. SL43]|nr:prepilin peptidase [Devosia sp. SL43]
MDMPTVAFLLPFPVAMAWAASSDLLTMRISNMLVLFLAASFCVVALVANLSLQQFAMHLTCGIIVLAVGFALFALRWIGGGDAKLAAVTALWLGFDQNIILQYLLYSAVLGGVLTLLILAFRGVPLFPLIARHRWLERLHDRKAGVPYGIALAIAGLVAYSNSTIFERLVA